MLVRRCAKPDQKEFNKIIMATGMGFVLMGFIGFFVKVCGSCELSLHRHVRVARYTLHSPPRSSFKLTPLRSTRDHSSAHVHSHQQRHRLQLVVNANAGLECHRRAEYSSNRRNIFHICFRERTVVRIQ